MKTILTIILSSIITICNSQDLNTTRALKIVVGKFAFCGASGTSITKDTIIVQGKKFIQGIAYCPVMEGPSVVNTLLVPTPTITPDGTNKTVWSYFWYYDSVPQAPSWENLPTVNRTLVVSRKPGGGMSNMWCMPCEVLAKKINGVTIAKCKGPINEMAFPIDQAVRALPGMTSVTQAPIGASYPVGTIIPAVAATTDKTTQR